MVDDLDAKFPAAGSGTIAPPHSAPSTRPVRPSHQVCEALSIAIQAGLCGLDVHATPTDDDVAEEEEGEVQVNDEHSAEGGEDPAAEEEVVRIASDPGQPSHKQVEEHRTRRHIPYRSWCQWRNLGRGRDQQHRARPSSLIPIVAIVYFLLTEAGVKLRSELELTDEAVQETRAKGR